MSGLNTYREDLSKLFSHITEESEMGIFDASSLDIMFEYFNLVVKDALNFYKNKLGNGSPTINSNNLRDYLVNLKKNSEEKQNLHIEPLMRIQTNVWNYGACIDEPVTRNR